MKRIKLFSLLILLSLITSGYAKHIAVKYDNFNTLFSGEITSNDDEQLILTLRSLQSDVVCSGKVQVTDFVLLYFINPSYNGVFGNANLSCSDGSKLSMNWKSRKLVLNNANGIAKDANGHRLSFYISRDQAIVNTKLETYKNDVAKLDSLNDYNRRVLVESKQVLVKDENSNAKEGSPAVQKKETNPVEAIPAVVQKEGKTSNNLTPAVVKNEEKAKVSQPVIVKDGVNTNANTLKKSMKSDNKIIPVNVHIEHKINNPEVKKDNNAVELKLDENKLPIVNADVKQPAKEVVTTFNTNKQSDISELKDLKTSVEVTSKVDKVKALNELSGISSPANVFSWKKFLLKLTFGYNVSNSAEKY